MGYLEKLPSFYRKQFTEEEIVFARECDKRKVAAFGRVLWEMLGKDEKKLDQWRERVGMAKISQGQQLSLF